MDRNKIRSLSRKPWGVLVVVLVTVSLLLAACGGGSTPPAATKAPAEKAASAAATAAPAKKLAGTEIRIGALIPITGPYSTWGRSNVVVINALIDMVNKEGGVAGLPVKLFHYDSAKPDEAARLMRRLAADDKVLAVAGPFSTGEANVVFPLANREAIVSISHASSAPGLAEKNRPWAFRNTVDEGAFMDAVTAAVVKKTGAKKAALIYDSKDAVGTSLGTQVIPAMAKKNGLEIINAGDPLTYHTEDLDVSAQVTKLKQLNPDVVLLGGCACPGGLAVMREMKKQGLKMPLLGGSPLLVDTTLQAYPELPIIAGGAYFLGLGGGAAEFESVVVPALQKSDVPNKVPTMQDAAIWEAMRWFFAAVDQGGVTNKPEDLTKDRERIRDYIANLKGFKGLAGNIDMTPTGDVKKDFKIAVGQNGKWQEYK